MEIEFADWPTATEKSDLVDPIVASFCRAPSPTELKAREAERKRWEGVFTDHRTVLLEGAGHYIQEDAPEAIVAAIREWRPTA